MMRGWAQSMWDAGQTAMASLSEQSQQFMGMALPAAEEMFGWASEQRDRFNKYVQPQMESLFSEAETYASKGEEDRQRGAAIQDVKSAMEAQRAATERKLEGLGGLDPSVVRNQAMDKTWGAQQAAVSALAANQAGERTKQIGRDLRTQAIDVGQRYLTDAQQAAQSGSYIGSNAMNSANQTANTGINLQQGALPFMQGSGNATNTAAGIVDTSYGRELDSAADQRAAEAANAAGMAGLGRVAGYALAPMTGGASLALTHMGAPGGAEGGTIMAPGTPTSDSGALQVSDGEYLVPADVVRKMGTNYFDKMIEKETGRAPPSAKIALPTGGM